MAPFLRRWLQSGSLLNSIDYRLNLLICPQHKDRVGLIQFKSRVVALLLVGVVKFDLTTLQQKLRVPQRINLARDWVVVSTLFRTLHKRLWSCCWCLWCNLACFLHKRQAQTFEVVLSHDRTKFRIQVLVSFGLLLPVAYITFSCLHILLLFLFASIFQLFLEIWHSSESFISIAFNWFVPYFLRVGREINWFWDLTSLVGQISCPSSRSIWQHASIVDLSKINRVIYWDIHHWGSLETSLLFTLQSAIILDLTI